MKAAIRVCLIATLLAAVAAMPVRAQETQDTGSVPPAVRSQVLARYRVLVVRDGVVLTPRQGETQSIEITDKGIAIDGSPVSGREIRDRLGDDAAAVLQLSYASPDELRRAFAGESAAKPAPDPPVSPAAPDPPTRDDIDVDDNGPWRHSGAKVRLGGSVNVDENEQVGDAVVAIGGSVRVLGRVNGDVVAIGGGVYLGPKANVRGSVTSIGGLVRREDGAQVRGEVVELGVGMPFMPAALAWGFDPDVFSGWFRLIGTALRISLLLLITLLIAAVADRPVSRIASKVSEDPWLSGFVGVAAEILFVPILVVTVVFLAISIVGIPLLLLLPFALVALFLGLLVGFAGVARRVGRLAVGDLRGPMVATAVGVVLVAAGTILARLLWLAPGPIWPLAMAVSAVGLFLEYVAWTTALGALLLTRFGTGRKPAAAVWSEVPPPVPPAAVPEG